MKKFRVTVTRDTTESMVVVVPAATVEEARETALDVANYVVNPKTKAAVVESDWAVDDGNQMHPYIPDPDDEEEVA